MKFIRRGAVRIASDPSGEAFAHVAFRNPDGSVVLVAANAAATARRFAVDWQGRRFIHTLPAQSLATYRW